MGEFNWENEELEDDEIDTGPKMADDLGGDDDEDEISMDEEVDLANSEIDELDYSIDSSNN
jgi:hypothetical protein